jgi:hypothetical protein
MGTSWNVIENLQEHLGNVIENLWEHLGNVIENLWEHLGNLRNMLRRSLRKKYGSSLGHVEHLIGSMKILFVKLFVFILYPS